MGIFDKLTGHGNKRKGVWSITPLGASKSESLELPVSKQRVLEELKSEPCSTQELARNTGMGDEKVEIVLRSLINDGYVQKSGATE